MFELTGQTAIVTGAATGIGEAIARRLARAGAAIAVADLDADGASAVAAPVFSRNGQIFAAVSIAGHETTFTTERLPGLIENVLAAATATSRGVSIPRGVTEARL